MSAQSLFITFLFLYLGEAPCSRIGGHRARQVLVEESAKFRIKHMAEGWRVMRES